MSNLDTFKLNYELHESESIQRQLLKNLKTKIKRKKS